MTCWGPPTRRSSIFKTLPFEEEEIKRIYAVRDFVGGATGLDAQIADTFHPTCNISGIISGWTEERRRDDHAGAGMAKVDMRLIRNQDPAVIEARVREHLARRGFSDVQLTIHRGEFRTGLRSTTRWFTPPIVRTMASSRSRACASSAWVARRRCTRSAPHTGSP